MDEKVRDAIHLLKHATGINSNDIVKKLLTEPCCKKPFYLWPSEQNQEDIPTIWSVK